MRTPQPVRSHTAAARVTATDYMHIKQSADQAGVTVSVYLEGLIRKDNKKYDRRK